MKKSVSILSALALLVLLNGCTSTEKVDVLKSPCVGIDGSPCGPKRPMNGNYNQDARNIVPEIA